MLTRIALVVTGVLLAFSIDAGRFVVASEAPGKAYSLGDSVPLDESDLTMITLQVMEAHPLLSSSPGIKSASAQRSVRSTDIASIIYFPHAESAGIRQAFQVRCLRQVPNELWACGDVEIRRYIQLDSQDFEVRVTGDIGHEAALALIQATRGTARASATGDSAVPDTAIMIVPTADKYVVVWGSDEGYSKFAVEAQIRTGGNASNPEDWETKVFLAEE